jgi:hypothetical protein
MPVVEFSSVTESSEFDGLILCHARKLAVSFQCFYDSQVRRPHKNVCVVASWSVRGKGHGHEDSTFLQSVIRIYICVPAKNV